MHYFGKPHAPIYRDCFALLKVTDRSRILAVGDSLRTDIAGANAAGIDGLLGAGRHPPGGADRRRSRNP